MIGRRALVFAGGVLGTAARVAVGDALDTPASAWPWDTLIVNLAGAFLLAYLVARTLRAAHRTGPMIAFGAIGLIGAFTTFSSFTVEIWRLGEEGRADIAGAYALTSVVAGVSLAYAGLALATRRP